MFFEKVEQNTFISSVNLGPRYKFLVLAHDLWIKAMEALNPIDEDALLAGWFLKMASSSWLAGLRVGLGGQPTEAQPLFRSALESAGYAAHFHLDASRRVVWLSRHDSSEAERACRDVFTTRNVRESLTALSPKVREYWDYCYNKSIDWGAHPNEKSLMSRLDVRRDEANMISSLTLISDRRLDYKFVAHGGAEVAATCVAVFNRIFESKFRLAGIDSELDSMIAVLRLLK
jgi:hypothetical protein